MVPLGKLELELELGVTVTEYKLLRELLTDAVSVAEEYPMAAAGGGGAWGSWIERAACFRGGEGVDRKTGGTRRGKGQSAQGIMRSTQDMNLGMPLQGRG